MTKLLLRMVFALVTSVSLGSASAQVPAGGPTAPPQKGVETPSYIIGPGDTLSVSVYGFPDYSATAPVRPDGKISTPHVEDMVAVGKTSSALARDIEKVLAEYIRTPQVNVMVTNAVSTFSQVKVIGQVANPQSVAYREGMRVLDVLLTAGGLGPYAAGNRAKLIRMQDGKEITIKLRLGDLINKGAMKNNLELKPGDVLVVPESMF